MNGPPQEATQWYWEDFEVGQVHKTMSRTVTETDIVNFVGLSGVFEQLFIDARYAREEGIFEQRIAPALLTLAIAEGLYVLTGHTHHGRAFLGLDELRLAAPVRCDDSVRVEVAVEVSRKVTRPGHGLIELRHRVFNQEDTEVMSYKTIRLIGCAGAER